MKTEWDVLVVGAGVNGLAAACVAAKAGRSVLVLERREQSGGLAAGEEFHPGYHDTGVLLDTTGLRPWIEKELELGKHGLSRRLAPLVLVAERDGPGIVLGPEPQGVNETDRRRFEDYRGFLDRIGPVLCRFTDRPPADLLDTGAGDFLRLALTGLALRRLGRQTMSELLRVAPTAVADWLDELFEHPVLKAGLAAPAIWASRTGPRAPGTSLNLLLAETTASDPVAGGGAALVDALARATLAAGADLRTEAEVEEILVENGRAVGARLVGGEEMRAGTVAVTCDPRRLFLHLLPPGARSRRLTEDLLHYRARGTTAKLDLALAGEPEFAGREGQSFEMIRVGGSLEALERAADAVKYRRFSEDPLLEIRLPTIAQTALAPPGHHVLSALVHFAPHDLEGGWSEERREALTERTIATLARQVPRIRDQIVGRRMLTPADLEARYGLTGGHLFHGEHALDQLLVRPVPGCAQYATPIPGLFLCGAGSHPGGGLTGVPGVLGGRALLAAGGRS